MPRHRHDRESIRRTSLPTIVTCAAISYIGATYVGKFIESKLIKNPITESSSQTDKILAAVTNNGLKFIDIGAFRGPIHEKGKLHIPEASGIHKSVAGGMILSGIADIYYRYTHNGVPTDYKLFDIPILSNHNLCDNVAVKEWIPLTDRQLQENNNIINR